MPRYRVRMEFEVESLNREDAASCMGSIMSRDNETYELPVVIYEAKVTGTEEIR